MYGRLAACARFPIGLRRSEWNEAGRLKIGRRMQSCPTTEVSAFKGALRQVQKLEREIFHPRVEFADAASEKVVENVSGNRRRQPKRRGDERFGNTRRHRTQARP